MEAVLRKGMFLLDDPPAIPYPRERGRKVSVVFSRFEYHTLREFAGDAQMTISEYIRSAVRLSINETIKDY